MPVPASTLARRRAPTLRHARALLFAFVLTAPCVDSLHGATRPPETRIPLESLGYIPFASQVLTSGASILTLNYVDSHHLLVTFSRRRLLKRIPDDPPQDFDRNIDAVLVDLPSGEVLARTSWRLHDPAQYLWDLGNGHFLLRIRDRLTTISPLANLKAGDAFKEHPLLSSPRPIGAVLLSPDASLLILESLDRLPPAAPEHSPSPGTQAYAAAEAAKEAEKKQAAETTGTHLPVQIHFYRLRGADREGSELLAENAGTLAARHLVTIPADGAGFISILDQGRQHWAFNYNLYQGRVEELSPFDSTCHPMPILVSRSEFISFGCRSGSQRQMFGGFNLRGEEMWEQVLPETYLNPGFSFAPSAGRFAFGRVTTAAVVGDNLDAVVGGQYSSELVTVYQTDSGKQILRLECTPILPAGQNFALSPDGSDLAIIRDSAIEIHHLPPLSAKDRAGIAKAASLAPEPSAGPILLTTPLTNAEANAEARAATRAGTPIATPPIDPATHRPSAIVDSTTVVAVPSNGSNNADLSPSSSSPQAGKPLAGSTALTDPAAKAAPAEKDRAAEKDGATEKDRAAETTQAAAKTAADPAPPQTVVIQNGDASPQTEGRRKPPTLYAPGEHPNTADDPPSKPR